MKAPPPGPLSDPCGRIIGVTIVDWISLSGAWLRPSKLPRPASHPIAKVLAMLLVTCYPESVFDPANGMTSSGVSSLSSAKSARAVGRGAP